MDSGKAPAEQIRFGAYELNLRVGELRKNGAKLKLQEQPFQILRVLLEKPGQVVTREELRERIWPADTFVDFDHGLYTAMTKLREVLRDSSVHPRFIETLPRRGYRFIAPVDEVQATTDPIEASASVYRGLLRSLPLGKRRTKLILLGSGVCVALILAIVLLRKPNSRRMSGPIKIQSLAVLPLENLSHDPEQEYFAEGMTEELITDLAQVSALRVISRSSVLVYKRRHVSTAQIARDLRVDALLEGRYRGRMTACGSRHN